MEQVKAAISEALAILPRNMNTRAAWVMLLAIGLQESRLIHRKQIGGPARGLWQFEDGPASGLAGLLRLPTTAPHMRTLCKAQGVDANRTAIYRRLEHDDVLAAGVARLLLWSDPKPLPAIGDVDGAWNCYLRNWRPGKPHRKTWGALYSQAVGLLPADFSRVTGSVTSTERPA